MVLEICATILGLMQGYLAMINKRSNWIFYIFQMLFLIAFSFINHLYGDVFNNSIYLIMGIIGFVLWNTKNDSSKITSCKTKERVAYTLIILVGALFVGNRLSSTNDPLPWLDGFTTVSSLVATYYMMNKKIDTWVIWFVNDILYAVEYYLLPDQAFYLFLLNIVWTLMAVGSYYNWKKLMKEGDEDDKNVLFRNIQCKT